MQLRCCTDHRDLLMIFYTSLNIDDWSSIVTLITRKFKPFFIVLEIRYKRSCKLTLITRTLDSFYFRSFINSKLHFSQQHFAHEFLLECKGKLTQFIHSFIRWNEDSGQQVQNILYTWWGNRVCIHYSGRLVIWSSLSFHRVANDGNNDIQPDMIVSV